MIRLQRLKLQSKDDPTKFKYITTSDFKIGDTITFKWHKAWEVVKIIKDNKGEVNIFAIAGLVYLGFMLIVLLIF